MIYKTKNPRSPRPRLENLVGKVKKVIPNKLKGKGDSYQVSKQKKKKEKKQISKRVKHLKELGSRLLNEER